MPDQKRTLNYEGRAARPWTDESGWIHTIYFAGWLACMAIFVVSVILSLLLL